MDSVDWMELGERLTPQEMDTIALLVRLEQHHLLTRLGEGLADVTQVVHEMNLAGELTAKFKVSQPNAGETMTAITVAITKKLPGHKPLGAFAYYDPATGFSEDDPRQTRLDVGRNVERQQQRRAVNSAERIVRKVGED